MYTALNPDKAEFRLLRLLPASSTEDVACEMQPFSLLDGRKPVYKALSYTWGAHPCEHEISLNGAIVCVRKNLYSFLLQMQVEKRNRKSWFFVDALCINQDDTAERTYQVSLMGKVYTGAEEVLAWIIPEPFYITDDKKAPWYVYYDESEALVNVAEESLDDLKTLVLYNTYWSRLWIVQEALLAKRLTLRMGHAEIEWTNLLPERDTEYNRKRYPAGMPTKNHMLTMGAIAPHGTPFANKTMAFQILAFRRSIARLRRAGYSWPFRLPFQKAVDFFAFQDCTRPHDKAFGMLGFTNSHITVDYSMSLIEIFMVTLADYLLSLGFLTEKRKVTDMFVVFAVNLDELRFLAPFAAFGLEPFDPVVWLTAHEVFRFFAPNEAETLLAHALIGSWLLYSKDGEERRAHWFEFSDNEPASRVSAGMGMAKLFWNDWNSFRARWNEARELQKSLAKEDSMMTAPYEAGESKTYSEWVASARKISNHMLERVTQSGEDATGDLDDEAWALVG